MNDQAILTLFNTRDEQVIEAVKRKYGKYLSTIAQNILHNVEDVEEVVNDTLYRAWRSIPPDQPKMLFAYLGKLTRNAALDRYRADHARKRTKDEVSLASEELDTLFSESIAEASAEQAELSALINRFLTTLPQQERIILVGRYFYLYPVKEIAVRLNLTQNHVSVILNRTLKKLKNFLSKENYQ